MGLAPWSEQCAESLHHDFLEIWNYYKVNEKEKLLYGEKLLEAVCAYNGRHL